MAAAERLDAVGLEARDIVRLWGRAGKGKKPHGLFAHWIDNTDEALKELGKQ